MTTHTPGPWAMGDSDLPVSSLAVCGLPDGRRHGTIVRFAQPRPDGMSFDESYCNARLIAAAPDLLAALQAVADYWAGGDVPEEIDAQMHAAIRKAEGK